METRPEKQETPGWAWGWAGLLLWVLVPSLTGISAGAWAGATLLAIPALFFVLFTVYGLMIVFFGR